MSDLRRPTVADLDALPPVAALTATPDLEDMNGHMNVRHHYTIHMDGIAAAFEDRAGLNQSWIDRTGESAFSVEHHLQFHSEVLIGDALSVHLRTLGRSDKAIHAMSILLDRTTGKVASTLEFVELYVDLTTRRPTPMPEELAKQFDDLLAEAEGLDWDLPRSHELGTSKRR
ncbi:acyl-CoA thioester hydrolase [Mumia flava]|uniref:Acyl-CoA thioester hydrolase n=1 Tax=Mumia flava TaxID=1348852 RepID=A0A2M9B723_9ACTN|nr:thioesterase family protein [Mumia flava]PJJ53722.1 acyl-CoA thioester hydrolase [Mumia flava]